MRKATRISLALGTSAALLSLSALPASAADAGLIAANDSHATIEVSATGSLTMDVATTPIDDIALKPGAQSGFTAPIVTVTDNRSWITGWNTTVKMTKFVIFDDLGAPAEEEDPRESIIPTDLAYHVEDFIPTGDVRGEIKSDGAKIAELNQEQDVVKVESPYGDNAAKWTPSVSFKVPTNALVGKYTATLTHSLY
ncbi:hypothetical protein ACIQXM_13060 [Arthrobacter sp. NPDC097144]|uniref:hypothetical protein n=1 Tax=Arthrobacter sp. NPDC097144 TaxID=3363946 RepID=UPI003801E2FF